MELQGEAILIGRKYVEDFLPNVKDLEMKAWLQNAAAAGYIAGYRAKDKKEKNE